LSSTGSSEAQTPPSASKTAGARQAAIHGQALSQRMSPERRRLTLGVLLSLLFHTLLLSLLFGGQGSGLPGFGFPWQDRRTEVPDLRVDLAPAPVVAAEPLPSARGGQPVATEPAMMTLVDPAPPPTVTLAANTPPASPGKVAKSKANAAAPAVPVAPVMAPTSTGQPKESTPPSSPKEGVIALAQSDQAPWAVPATSEEPAPVTAVAPSAPSPEVAMPPRRDAGDTKQDAQPQAEQAQADRQEAAQQEATRQATARQDAALVEATRAEVARQEAARQKAAREEMARQDASRQEAARVEAERQEAAKQARARQEKAQQEAVRAEAVRTEATLQEAARQAAAKAEAAQTEAARQEATKQARARQETAQQEAVIAEAARADAKLQEAARLAAAKVEAVRAEAERQAAGRQAEARQEAARVEAARLATLQAEAEKREARLQAIGRQLNEEADRRDAAAAAQRLSPALPSSWSSLRRGRLFGRTDPNTELIAYAEAWGRKIQLNMTFDMVREAAKQPHTDPMVTVALRSDGSVESVSFVRSSGVAAIDEVVRRIVHSQANYQAFPPGLVREFDVIEIRRTWHFDMAIRLY
jgi:TonB C terminal